MISNNACNDAQEQFDIYELGLGPLNHDAKKLMESHFGGCEPCQKWLSDWQLITLDARSMEQLEVPSTVLASIMSKIETATADAAVETAVQARAKATEITAAKATELSVAGALTPLFKSDALIALVALAALLLVGLHYASEGFEGTASWCFSFIVLFAANHFFQGKEQEPQLKTHKA